MMRDGHRQRFTAVISLVDVAYGKAQVLRVHLPRVDVAIDEQRERRPSEVGRGQRRGTRIHGLFLLLSRSAGLVGTPILAVLSVRNQRVLALSPFRPSSVSLLAVLHERLERPVDHDLVVQRSNVLVDFSRSFFVLRRDRVVEDRMGDGARHQSSRRWRNTARRSAQLKGTSLARRSLRGGPAWRSTARRRSRR